MMFDNRYRRYIQSFFLVLPMTGIVTVVNTIVAKGLEAVLTVTTLQKWAISFAVAYPVVLFIAPLSVKTTDRLIKKDSN